MEITNGDEQRVAMQGVNASIEAILTPEQIEARKEGEQKDKEARLARRAAQQ